MKVEGKESGENLGRREDLAGRENVKTVRVTESECNCVWQRAYIVKKGETDKK